MYPYPYTSTYIEMKPVTNASLSSYRGSGGREGGGSDTKGSRSRYGAAGVTAGSGKAGLYYSVPASTPANGRGTAPRGTAPRGTAPRGTAPRVIPVHNVCLFSPFLSQTQ